MEKRMFRKGMKLVSLLSVIANSVRKNLYAHRNSMAFLTTVSKKF